MLRFPAGLINTTLKQKTSTLDVAQYHSISDTGGRRGAESQIGLRIGANHTMRGECVAPRSTTAQSLRPSGTLTHTEARDTMTRA